SWPGPTGFSACLVEAVFMVDVSGLGKQSPAHVGATDRTKAGACAGSCFDAGIYRQSAPVGGIYAKILNYSPWAVSDPGPSAWLMLEACPQGSGDCYQNDFVQIGWVEKRGGRTHQNLVETFGAHADSCGGRRRRIAPATHPMGC